MALIRPRATTRSFGELRGTARFLLDNLLFSPKSPAFTEQRGFFSGVCLGSNVALVALTGLYDTPSNSARLTR